MRDRDRRTVAPHVGQRHAVLFDHCHGVGIAFFDRAVERTPVAQPHADKRRLVKIIRLLAHEPPLRFGAHSSGTHQDRDNRRRAAHALPDEPPDRALPVSIVERLEIDFAGDVGSKNRTVRFAPHHIDRKIVHHSSIDEKVAVMRHRRKNSRKRNARSQRAPDQPRAMLVDPTGRQVRRDAEEWLSQLLDAAVAEIAAQQRRNLFSSYKRDQRQRVIRERIVANKRVAHALG